MARAVALAALLAALAAALLPGSAAAFSRLDGSRTMDDGVALATTLYLPDGESPAAGWPAVVLLHGLGRTRADSNQIAERYFANAGYAVLTYDARGHGGSGGLVSLAGPREVADLRALVTALGDRPDVDASRIGAWGISYGGGEILNGLVAGVPLAAAAVVQTWTSLGEALAPQGLPKTGILLGLLGSVPPSRWAPDLTAARNVLVAGDAARLRAFTVARSSLGDLSRVTTPTFLLQGRRDFTFGMEQAIGAYARLAGPKRLYLGDHGHYPSRFPANDSDAALKDCVRWFDRYLKGEPNGIDAEPPVGLAPSPWKGTVARYPGLPPARTTAYALPGAQRIGPGGLATRFLPGRTRSVLETFGSPVVRVTATARRGWPRLVAALVAETGGGRQILVSAGGVPTRPGRHAYAIRLISDATAIPQGARLRVSFASSTAAIPASFVYLDPPLPPAARLEIGDASLALPALVRPVSAPR